MVSSFLETDASTFGIRWMVRMNQLYPIITRLSPSSGTLKSRYVPERQIISNLKLNYAFERNNLKVMGRYAVEVSVTN